MDKKDKYATIKDVEVFAVGTWNNKTFKGEDLDSIVKAFNEFGKKRLKPYLKLGHDDKQPLKTDGMPSFGWVDNLRKVGKKLVADFINVPEKLAELMSKGAYRRVSVELYNDFKAFAEETLDGVEKTFPFMLKAIALLGAETPAVTNLEDIVALGFSVEDDTRECLVYEFSQDKYEEEAKKMEELKKAKEEIAKYKADNEKLEAELQEAVEKAQENETKLAEAEKKAEEYAQFKAEQAEKEITDEISAFVSELVEEKKMLPGQVDVYTKVLRTAYDSKEVVKFTKDEQEVEESVFESLKRSLKEQPEVALYSKASGEAAKKPERTMEVLEEAKYAELKEANPELSEFKLRKQAQLEVSAEHPDLYTADMVAEYEAEQEED